MSKPYRIQYCRHKIYKYLSLFLLLIACEDPAPLATPDRPSTSDPDQNISPISVDAFLIDPTMQADADLIDRIDDQGTIDRVNDSLIPPDYDYSEVTRLALNMSQNESKAGEVVNITCLAFDQDDRPVTEVETRIIISPVNGWRQSSENANEYIGYQAQEYQVYCSAASLALRSDRVSWNVVMGDVLQTVAQLNQQVIRAGDTVTGTCLGRDQWGNQYTLREDEVVWSISPTLPSTVITSSQISIERAGTYEVACQHNQADSEEIEINREPTWVQVQPNLAASMSLSVQPQQEIYAVGQVLQFQIQVWDAYQNLISPTPLIWEVPEGLESFARTRYRLSQEGSYTISVEFDGETNEGQTLSQQVTLQVDSSGPIIFCENPLSGSMQIWQENMTFQGSVSDESEIESLWVDGMEVALEDGRFSTIVQPRKGLNWHTITAIDTYGNSNEILCSYIAADEYLPVNQAVDQSIVVNLGPVALDDEAPARPIQSMTDLFRIGLEADGLEQEINQQAIQQNPVIPSQCFQRFFGSCVLRLSADFNSLSLGTYEVNLQPQGDADRGSLRFVMRFNDVIMNLTIRGSSSLGGINTTGDISVSFIEIQGDFDIRTVAGEVQVSLIPNSAASSLGDLDSDFTGLSGNLIDLVFPFFESYIRDSISQTIEDSILAQIDTTLSQAFSGFNLSDLSFAFDIVGLNGEAITVNLNTILSDMSVNQEGLKISLDTTVDQSQNNEAPPGFGVPILYNEWNEVPFDPQMTMRLRLALINQLLYVLWQNQFFNLSNDEDNLQFTLQAPPIMTWKGEGNLLSLHFGPARASFSPSDLFPNALQIIVLATLESEVAIDPQGALTFAQDGLNFDEFDIYIEDLMIGPEERQAIKDEIGALIIAFANEGLSDTLPSLPLPNFALPPELNLPLETTLGLRQPNVSMSPRNVTLSGQLGE